MVTLSLPKNFAAASRVIFQNCRSAPLPVYNFNDLLNWRGAQDRNSPAGHNILTVQQRRGHTPNTFWSLSSARILRRFSQPIRLSQPQHFRTRYGGGAFSPRPDSGRQSSRMRTSICRGRCLGNRAAILRSKNFFETGAMPVPVAVRLARRLRVGVFAARSKISRKIVAGQHN